MWATQELFQSAFILENEKFTLIEQLTKPENVSKATLKFRLKQRKDF